MADVFQRVIVPARRRGVAWRPACSDLVGEGRARLQTLGPLVPLDCRCPRATRLGHLDVDDGMVEAVATCTRGHALHPAAPLGVVGGATTVEEAQQEVSAVPLEDLALIAHQVDRLPEDTRVALEALVVLSPSLLSARARVLDPSRLALARVRAGVEYYRRRVLPEALALLNAVEAAPPAVVPTLTVHRALCLEGLAARLEARDARALDDELDAAVGVALAAGNDELAVLAEFAGDAVVPAAVDLGCGCRGGGDPTGRG